MRHSLFTRALAAMLAVLSLVCFAACAGSGDGAETTVAPAVTDAPETTPAETAPTTDQWGRELVDVDLPADLKFEGETFTILSRDSEYQYYEFYTEEITGDIVKDAIYDRNARIEERIGVKIENRRENGSFGNLDKYRAIITNQVLSDTKEFEAAATYAYGAAVPGLLNAYYNLADLPNTNYEKPWWRQSYIEAATAHGQFYTVISDLNLSVIDNTLLCYFNKKYAEQYQLGNLYELVLEGKWTIDKMTEMTTDVNRDVNNNGSLEQGDFFGIVGCRDSEAFDGFFAAFNMQTIGRDADGMPVLDLDIDRATRAIEKLNNMFYANNGALTLAGWKNPIAQFTSGESIFAITTLMSSEMNGKLRDMTDDYGILPLPKLDESQENYGTTPQDSYNAMGVMRNIDNPEMVGATMELLAAESWKTVRPEYCENTMKYRYMRDSESGQIFDIIVDSVFFDYSMIFCASLNNLGTIMRPELQNNRNTLASQMAVQKKLVPKLIQKIDDVFVERSVTG